MIHSFIQLTPFFWGVCITHMQPDVVIYQVKFNQPNRAFFLLFFPISEFSQIDNYSQEDLAKFCYRQYMIIYIYNYLKNPSIFFAICWKLAVLEIWKFEFSISKSGRIFFKANIFTKILCMCSSRNIPQFEEIGKAQKENAATNLKS